MLGSRTPRTIEDMITSNTTRNGLIAVAATALLVLTGCGDNSPAEADPAPTVTATEIAESPNAGDADDDRDDDRDDTDD